ncbi:hypothetical protein HN011_010391 [Eciton burchellii]|nr:hypothetical protein HN011_010391 [Eciton burchellii]
MKFDVAPRCIRTTILRIAAEAADFNASVNSRAFPRRAQTRAGTSDVTFEARDYADYVAANRLDSLQPFALPLSVDVRRHSFPLPRLRPLESFAARIEIDDDDEIRREFSDNAAWETAEQANAFTSARRPKRKSPGGYTAVRTIASAEQGRLIRKAPQKGETVPEYRAGFLFFLNLDNLDNPVRVRDRR